MADEPRRSGRATKGQNHKNSEEPDATPAPVAAPPPPAKKGGKKAKGKSAKKNVQEVEEEEEPEAIIRCICGYVEEDPDDKRAMICCDKCSAWQHNVCMGMPEDDDELPEQYFCEQCKPSDHQQTVLALKRGERIWETRQAEHERQEEEERQRKKGGRKGRKSKGGKPIEAVEAEKQDSSQATDQSPSQAIPATTFYGKSEGGLKRKVSEDAGDDQIEEEANASKTRRVSSGKDVKSAPRRQSSMAGQKNNNTKQVELQTELVEKIEDLHNRVRQRAAAAFVKLFEQITQQAITDGTFKLPRGQSKESFALSLGLSVEYCLYIGLWGHGSEPNPPYSEKMRVILHNIKANPELRDRLLSQSLSPSALTEMSSDEMASRELQAEKAQIIKETEKQHILLPDTGPKFRKTHKGDELIEDASHHYVSTESAPQLSTRALEKGAKEESPDRTGSHSPTAFQPTSFKNTGKPLTVDTQSRRSTIDRKSSSGFDMNNVWSAVESPSAARPLATPNTPGIKGPGAKADAEIDQLLGGNDDEAPYSPMDYTLEDGMIWRGPITMPTVAEFHASARYAAGANLEKTYPWRELIGPHIWIEGRIKGSVASDYVCNLRYSKTTDVTVISLKAEDQTEHQEDFDKLFNYFTNRQRWGVAKSPLPYTRDVYVIPLEAGNGPKPEFLNLLGESVVEDDRPHRTLLVVYIIKLATPEETSGLNATPATPGVQVAYSPANGKDTARSPAKVDHHASARSGHQDGALPAGSATTHGPQKTGREAAEFVLGPSLIGSPTVEAILAQAPNTAEDNWFYIRACYLEDPRTMTDWPLLMAALTDRAEKRDAEEAAEKARLTGGQA